MKTFVMLSYDTVFKPRLLYQLLLRRGDDICGVAEVKKVRRRNRPGRPKLRSESGSRPPALGPWGWKGGFWLGCWTVWNKLRSALPFPRVLRVTSTIKRVARAFHVPYHLVDDISDPAFLEVLAAAEPDVIVSFQHQIFRQAHLATARIACINCHPALLPKHRGCQPLFWAMLEGEATLGVSVHTMDAAIDAGQLVAQVETPLRHGWTMAECYAAAHELSTVAILAALDRLELRGTGDLIPLSASARYYRRPGREDVARFRAAGHLAI